MSLSSNVSAKLVVQQMFLWLNMTPRVQPAGDTSLDTLTCHTSEEQCDYSEGGGKEKKKSLTVNPLSRVSRLCCNFDVNPSRLKSLMSVKYLQAAYVA